MSRKTDQNSRPKRKRRIHHPVEFGYTTSRDFKRAMVKGEVDQDDNNTIG